ncbi:MAG: hypothetical protein HC769_18865 [Cyanobacteria bacterium CRU_2_1]|nr:hypothetical protein [Cyanobacteria bacterium CRU_2_1]
MQEDKFREFTDKLQGLIEKARALREASGVHLDEDALGEWIEELTSLFAEYREVVRKAEGLQLDDHALEVVIKGLQEFQAILFQLNGNSGHKEIEKILIRSRNLIFYTVQQLIENCFEESLRQIHNKHDIFLDSRKQQQLEPDFVDLRSEILKKFMEKIHEFNPKHPKFENKNISFKAKLKIWIRNRLRLQYRILDLLLPTREISGDVSKSSENRDSIFELLPDDRSKESKFEIEVTELFSAFRTYCMEDPQGKLRVCFIKHRKEITIETVVLLLLDLEIYSSFYASSSESQPEFILNRIAASLKVDKRSASHFSDEYKCLGLCLEDSARL